MSIRIDNTGFGELKILQDSDQFCYGVDAVLLADFASRSRLDITSAVDLGTGNGIIPLILSHKSPKAQITGIDIQKEALQLAVQTAQMNGLEDRLSFLNMDVKDAAAQLTPETVSLVTCNPPYFAKGAGLINDESAKFIARQETTASVEDFIRAAAHILRDRGHFCMIHRPSRLTDIIYYSRKYKLEPKEMRFISPREGKQPNMVLIRCIKRGGKELTILPTLYVYHKNREYTEEILEIYERGRK